MRTWRRPLGFGSGGRRLGRGVFRLGRGILRLGRVGQGLGLAAGPDPLQVADDDLPDTEVIRDRTDNEIVLEQNALMRGAKRIKIRLEQNKEIPPSGQFIGINGVGYLLVPGVDVEVPEFLLDALDAAVEDVPVLDERGNVAGYQKKTRFPYQIVRDRG